MLKGKLMCYNVCFFLLPEQSMVRFHFFYIPNIHVSIDRVSLLQIDLIKYRLYLFVNVLLLAKQ